MRNIQNHVSKLESNQNILIHLAHKNKQHLQILDKEMTHLGSIIETLIRYNPALVYAKSMSQVDDIANYIYALIDTVQILQQQKLSIKHLDLAQLHLLHSTLKDTDKTNDWRLLTHTPRDMFQLDTSYIRKGTNVPYR